MTHAELIARLIAERDRAGLTNYRLAKMAGISEAAVHRILAGQREPKLSTVVAMCDAVGMCLILAEK